MQMNTLVHADIFFFVTTVVVGVLGVLAIITWIYIIRILDSAHRLTKMAEQKGGVILDDLGEAAENLKERGFGIRTVFKLLKKLF